MRPGLVIAAKIYDWVLLRKVDHALGSRRAERTEFVDVAGSSERHVLAVHRSRFRAVPASGVTELGADEEAIESAQRTERLFDLGVTRSTSPAA